MEYDSAVSVRNACKSYGSNSVLKSLNMTVHRGTIYGLLGASGCGKTTLLSCIVGRRKLNSGEILVLGGTPGSKGSGVPGPRVGYMPQDIALIAEFTIRDAVYYFGRILEVKDSVIEQRFKMFCDLLELPPEDRYLKNCSGGQKRRVSFAAAMINMPELLILDEPTVGVDPVLRESIWNYLVETTAKHNMSVIVTTHYIEEARQANTIGLMREGKLLAEESPTRLLSIFNTDNLEEVFLILSRRQEEGRLDNLAVADDQNNSIENHTNHIPLTINRSYPPSSAPVQKTVVKRTSGLLFNGRRLRALMDKNWKQFYRNIPGVIFLLVFPLIQTCFFLSAIGNEIKDISVAVVNKEHSLSECSSFTFNQSAITIEDTCHLNHMSCRFLTYLETPMIRKIHYNSLEEGIDSAKHGDTAGIMYMSHNFSESLQERIQEGRFAKEEATNHSEIKVWMDMSNRQIGQTVKYKLIDLYLKFQKQVLKDCNFLEKMAALPLNFEDGIYGSTDEQYIVFMYPGALLTIIFFMGTLMTSQIIITDRCEGIWDRSAVAGVTAMEITITHFLLQASVIFVNMLEVLVIVYGLYHYDHLGSMWTLGVIVFVQGLAGMVYGFWVSVISVNHSMANIVTCGSFYPMILVCGMVWPLEGMPTVLQWIARCMPFTVATQSYRNVVKKGWPLSHSEVWNGVGIGCAWILIFGAISVLLIKKKQ